MPMVVPQFNTLRGSELADHRTIEVPTIDPDSTHEAYELESVTHKRDVASSIVTGNAHTPGFHQCLSDTEDAFTTYARYIDADRLCD